VPGVALRPPLLLLALVLASCSARSFPQESAPPAPVRAEPLALRAGVRDASAGPNVGRIRAGDVAERFARELREAGLFADVVFPLTELSPVEPDVTLEVQVASKHDLHPWQNLLKDLAVGLSVLLLQPLLPTTWDLDLDLGVRARDREGRTLVESRQSSRFRFESTWLRAPEDALVRWHADAVDFAVRALVARLAGEGAGWPRARPRGAQPSP